MSLSNVAMCFFSPSHMSCVSVRVAHVRKLAFHGGAVARYRAIVEIRRAAHLHDLGRPAVRAESEHGPLTSVNVVGAQFARLVDADDLVDDVALPRRQRRRLGRRADLLRRERFAAVRLRKVDGRSLRRVGVRHVRVCARRCAGDERRRCSMRRVCASDHSPGGWPRSGSRSS